MMLRFSFSKSKRRSGAAANSGSRGGGGFVITTLLLLNAVHCGPTSSSNSSKSESSKVSWMTEESVASGDEEFVDDSYADLLNVLNELKFYEDDEQMQGDQPIASSNQSTTESAALRDIRKRLEIDAAYHKQFLINRFRSMLPDVFAGNVSTPFPKDFTQFLEACTPTLQSANVPPSKTEVLPPFCSVPEHLVEDDRPGNKDLSLHFSSANSSSIEPIINVSEATLRLYKLPAKLNDSGNYDRDSGKTIGKTSEIMVTSFSPDVKQENKKINVTIYYRKLTSKKKVEKVNVGSRILNAHDESVTEWSILQVPEVVHKKNGFTFTVTVRDERGQPLPAQQFFNLFDCTKPNELPKTMPFFILGCVKKQYDSLSEDRKKYVDEITRLPTLEIRYWRKEKDQASKGKRLEDGSRVGNLYKNDTTNRKNRRHETAKNATKEHSSSHQNLSSKISKK